MRLATRSCGVGRCRTRGEGRGDLWTLRTHGQGVLQKGSADAYPAVDELGRTRALALNRVSRDS